MSSQINDKTRLSSGAKVVSLDKMIVFAGYEETNASCLLSSLKENYPFLRQGHGNILVTTIEYCKCRYDRDSLGEHEFLIVALKETVGARRSSSLMVHRLYDDSKKYTRDELENAWKNLLAANFEEAGLDPSLSSSPGESSTSIPAHRDADLRGNGSGIHSSLAKAKGISKANPSDALDKVIILTTRSEINANFDVLMEMDLTRLPENCRPVTLERFLHLLHTTSKNTPKYHVVYAQCYWYAYTIWRVLEIATGPRVFIQNSDLAKRQCSHQLMGYKHRLVLGKGDSVHSARLPETIMGEWKNGEAKEDKEWAGLKETVEAPEKACREAEAACLEAEDGRRQAEAKFQVADARVRELERILEGLGHPTGSAIDAQVF